MHSISALSIIAALIIIVLFIVGSVIANFDEEYYNTVETGYDARSRGVPLPTAQRITTTRVPEVSDRVPNHYSSREMNPRVPVYNRRPDTNPPVNPQTPVYSSRLDTNPPVNSPTPVYNTQPHTNPPVNQQARVYKAQPNTRDEERNQPRAVGGDGDRQYKTRQFHRPPTPEDSHRYRASTPMKPPRPVTDEARVYETTTRTDSAAVDRRAGGTATAVDDDHTRLYRKYDELSSVEKKDIVDLKRCEMYANRKKLHPLLQPTKKSSNGNSHGPGYAIVYFNTENDKELTAYEKGVRKSFKIKDVRHNRNRYARFQLDEHDDNYRILRFLDYTPYIEDYAPRFDPYKREFTTEESRWETMSVVLYDGTQKINGDWLNVLVPAE